MDSSIQEQPLARSRQSQWLGFSSLIPSCSMLDPLSIDCLLNTVKGFRHRPEVHPAFRQPLLARVLICTCISYIWTCKSLSKLRGRFQNLGSTGLTPAFKTLCPKWLHRIGSFVAHQTNPAMTTDARERNGDNDCSSVNRASILKPPMFVKTLAQLLDNTSCILYSLSSVCMSYRAVRTARSNAS